MAMSNGELLRIEVLLQGDSPITPEEHGLIAALDGDPLPDEVLASERMQRYVNRALAVAEYFRYFDLVSRVDQISDESKHAAIEAMYDDNYESSAAQREEEADAIDRALRSRHASSGSTSLDSGDEDLIAEATESTSSYEPDEVANGEATLVAWTRKRPLVVSEPVAPWEPPKVHWERTGGDDEIPF